MKKLVLLLTAIGAIALLLPRDAWPQKPEVTRIVQEAVKRTPLVVYSCDPFEHVTRLSRPGSNVTGTTCMTTELSPKRLELLKELLPRAKRVVFFGDPEDAPEGWRLTRQAAPKLGLAIQLVPYKDRDDIPAALQKIAKKTAKALGIAVPKSLLLRADRVVE